MTGLDSGGGSTGDPTMHVGFHTPRGFSICRIPTGSWGIMGDLTATNVQQFPKGLVFKAHRLLYHSTSGLSVIKKRRETDKEGYLGWTQSDTFLSECTYEALVNLLWMPHNFASLGALRAQIPPTLDGRTALQGYLAHKKQHPHRTLH